MYFTELRVTRPAGALGVIFALGAYLQNPFFDSIDPYLVHWFPGLPPLSSE